MRTIQLHSVVLAVLLCCSRCSAADLDFYQRFLSLVNTNDLRPEGATNSALVDKSNTAPKLTNTVIALQKLRTEGEVSNIRLGMTMADLVARWGKPIWLHPRCDGGHRFDFSDCSLVFVGNCLSKVRFRETAVFDQGLSAQSNLKDWEQILGEPTMQKRDSYGSSLVYDKYGKVYTLLILTFEPDGDVKFPPAIYLIPALTNWFRKSQP